MRKNSLESKQKAFQEKRRRGVKSWIRVVAAGMAKRE